MYKDRIKVANKIISSEDLLDIFSKMHEKLMYYKKINQTETMKNSVLEYNFRRWTFKDSGSDLNFTVNFYDNTSIKFDNYSNFVAIYNNRLHDIKSIYVRFCLYYSTVTSNTSSQFYNQHINIMIYENSADIDIALDSSDNKINDVYEFIKNKILNAPAKYNYVIKKKSSINMIVGFAIGFIPGITIATLLLLVPTIRFAFAESYVLYPICCLLLAFVIGGVIANNKLDVLYQNIVPEKKYDYYDSKNNRSVYKDDIDKYLETGEILIGKNVDNLRYRQEIMAMYNKYKKYLPYEILVVLILSVVVLFL